MTKPSIFINGASGTGKTTTAYAIRNLDPSFFRFSLDDFADQCRSEGKKINPKTWPCLRTDFAKEALSLVKKGKSLIIDTVCVDHLTPIETFSELFGSVSVFKVGMMPSLDALYARSCARNIVNIEGVLAQAETVHRGIEYDLEVDNSAISPQDVARNILNAYSQHYNI